MKFHENSQTAVFVDKYRAKYSGIQYMDSTGKSPYKVIEDHQFPSVEYNLI